MDFTVSEKMYDYYTCAYVVQVYNFTGSTELHMLGKELTLPDKLRYLVSYSYLCT
jgi:hypothetical protein